MEDDPRQIENVAAFLKNEAGTYQYRLWFSRMILGFAFIGLIGFPLGAYDLLSEHPNSLYATIEASLMIALGPYFIWSCFVVARKFKEIKIDHEGIRILPYGLHITPNEIKEIHRSENYADAETIELKLKAPHLIYHVAIWSLGRTMKIAFNNRLLTPSVVSS